MTTERIALLVSRALLIGVHYSCVPVESSPVLEIADPGEPPTVEVVVEGLLSVNFEITDLRYGRLTESGTEVLVAAGSNGFAVIEQTGDSMSVSSSSEFEEPPDLPYRTQWDIEIHDLDGDGLLEFVRFAGAWHGPIYGFDGEGRLRWSGEELEAPTFTIDMDVDRDGRTELLVGSESGITLHDYGGRKLWQSPRESNADAVVIEDEEVGCLIALTTNAGLTLVSGKGEFLESRKIPGTKGAYYNYAGVARNVPGITHALIVVGAYVDRLIGEGAQRTAVYDPADGSMKLVDKDRISPFIDSVQMPGATSNWLIKAVVEREQAPIAGFKSGQLRVSIYSESGALAFERVLEAPPVSSGHAILVEKDSFLVGYGTKLWRFRFAEGA